jgi:hypothetical protein
LGRNTPPFLDGMSMGMLAPRRKTETIPSLQILVKRT